MPPSLKSRRRIVGLFLGVMLVCMALFVRVGYVSLVTGPELAKVGLLSRLRAIPVTPPRGSIIDDEGRLLAGSRPTENIYAIPAQVTDARTAALSLAPILGRPTATIEGLLMRRQSVVWLKRQAGARVAAAVRRLGLSGIGVVQGSRRYDPEGPLDGAVLGYTGIDDQGLDGLELTYDRALRGKPGAVWIELDARNQPIPGKPERFTAPTPGDTVQLTLDQGIQTIASQAAERALQETGARATAVIVMNVKTGGITALAMAPTYDPNAYRHYPETIRREWVVADTFPPGSTFKIVTAAAALSSGAATVRSQFYDPGFVRVNGVRIRCWKAGGHGAIDFTDVVHNSCNVGFVDLGLRLGTDRFYSFLSRFHLIGRTGVDLPGEARNIIPPKKLVKPVDLATMAFGQTLSLTPISLLGAVSAVASGGVWQTPHLLEDIQSPSGSVIARPKVRRERILSPEVARELQGVLGGVVAEGTGKKGQVEGFRVAGKTGTAQAVINGHYVQGKYVSSFVGFGPLPDPAYAVLVLIDQPQGMYYGGQIAAPIFSQVMGQVLADADVPPDPALGDMTTVPMLTGKPIEAALSSLKSAGLRARVIGSGGRVSNQFPVAGTPLQKGSAVLVFGGGALRTLVPDLVGKAVPDALLALDKADLRADLVGVGVVVGQTPAAGTELKPGAPVRIIARPSTPPRGES